MRTDFMFAALVAAMIGAAGVWSEDAPGDAAIRVAIKGLQAKKAQAASKADKDKIEVAVAALEKLLSKAPAGGAGPGPSQEKRMTSGLVRPSSN